MLVSHKYKFIFLKSVKTGSTSTYIFFLPYCLPKEKSEKYDCTKLKNSRNQTGIYEEGMVGLIRKDKSKRQHVTASKVKNILDNIDSNIWENYFKFSIVRNPFDLLVSLYFYKKNLILNPLIEKFIIFENPKNLEEHKENFSKFLNNLHFFKLENGNPESYSFYKIKNKYICDYFIKYENLKEGIEYVCEKCNIENYNLENLKYFRSNSKPINIKYENMYRDMYDDKTKELVYDLYKEDFEKFDYKF